MPTASVPYASLCNQDDNGDREVHCITPNCILVTAALQGFFSGLAVLLSSPELGILGSQIIIFGCLTGSIGGAFCSIFMYVPKKPTVRSMAGSFLFASVFAVIFSPLAIELSSKTPTLAATLFISGGFGAFAFSLATKLRHIFIKGLDTADRK